MDALVDDHVAISMEIEEGRHRMPRLEGKEGVVAITVGPNAVSGSLLDAFADDAKLSVHLNTFCGEVARSRWPYETEQSSDKVEDLGKTEWTLSATDDHPQKPNHHTKSLAQLVP